MMGSPSWIFREKERSEINIDPIAGEFFTPEDPAEKLVRETIQNSMDARIGTEPVTVRFDFRGQFQPLTALASQQYLRGLAPHLSACKGVKFPEPGRPLRYLTVEDFGTRGLRGDPDQAVDVPGRLHEKNDFYYFWRNIGRSDKEGNDRGRWGLGKTVFPATSRVNSFLGLTVRASDRRQLLLGQSVLKVHGIGGKRYDPYGFFCIPEEDGFPRPLEDGEQLEQLRSDFNLSRRMEPGFSVVILHPDQSLTATDVLWAVLQNYFYPILAGDLVTNVVMPRETVVIDRNSIESVASSNTLSGGARSLEDLLRTFAFARWALDVKPEEVHVVAEPESGRPKLDESMFTSAPLIQLREQFDRGERLAFELPVSVDRLDSSPVVSTFRAYVEKDDALERGDEHYIRQGLSIPGRSQIREKRARGLVVIEDGPLSRLLGDAENPAHTEWQPARESSIAPTGSGPPRSDT